MLRELLFGLLLSMSMSACVQVAHLPPRQSASASAQTRCFEVHIAEGLETAVAVPTGLELRPDRAKGGLLRNGFVVRSLEKDGTEGHVQEEWLVPRAHLLQVTRGDDDDRGVLFDLVDEDDGSYWGTVHAVPKVGSTNGRKEATLRPVACQPMRASALSGGKALASTPEDATAASNAFGFDIYARVKQDGANLICSPFSAAVALNMASAGARGKTRAEMLSVLHVDPLRAAETHASFGGLLGALNARNGTDGVTLHIADRLWGQSGIGFKSDFLALLRDSYGAPLETVDFARAVPAARDTINHWVATQTHDRIPEILREGDLTPMTRLVLTNAVYFKGKWDKPFRPEETKPRRFTGVSGVADVPTMAQQATVAYARVGDVQLVELPYAGDLSMVVLLPDGAGDLPAVERKVARNYADWLAALRPAEVNLWLPRWTFNSRLDLGEPLQAAGMRLAFTEDADLSGTSTATQLYIYKVVQQAFVEVNETGAEAAAATAVVENDLASIRELTPPTPKIFHADHPFLYLIRDQKTGVVLFLGRVAGFGG